MAALAFCCLLSCFLVIASGTVWKPYALPEQWIVRHNDTSNLPPGLTIQDSNNCVGLLMFDDLLFIGWRTAPMHFASPKTMHYILSSSDLGQSWKFEHSIFLSTDMREPYFYVMNNTLFYSFFSAGTNPLGFDPQKLLRIQRHGFQQWSDPVEWGAPGEIAWQFDVVDNMAYVTSYVGNHYEPEQSNILVYFNQSSDGVHWEPVNTTHPVMYKGGVSEVGWTVDDAGNFWAVMRNEDGDNTGFGSHIVFAPKGRWGEWQLYPESGKSDPWIYESPRMFTHEQDVYLVARRDIDGPFDRGYTWLPFTVQKERNLAEYSLRPHTTALWRINQQTHQLEWQFDIPGDGDTAFPSIVKLGPHKFLIANYSSPLNHPNWSWLEGQTSSEGTGVYFIVVEFVAIS